MLSSLVCILQPEALLSQTEEQELLLSSVDLEYLSYHNAAKLGRRSLITAQHNDGTSPPPTPHPAAAWAVLFSVLLGNTQRSQRPCKYRLQMQTVTVHAQKQLQEVTKSSKA